MHTRCTRSIVVALSALILSTALLSMSGCSIWPSRLPRPWKKAVDLHVSVDQVPPILVDALNEHHMLILQSPNSGWSIDIDKSEQIAAGVRLFVTLRRPDPAFMYPQQIVEKRLLTEIRTENPIEIYARVLEANEKIDGQGYGQITPVESFDQQ